MEIHFFSNNVYARFLLTVSLPSQWYPSSNPYTTTVLKPQTSDFKANKQFSLQIGNCESQLVFAFFHQLLLFKVLTVALFITILIYYLLILVIFSNSSGPNKYIPVYRSMQAPVPVHDIENEIHQPEQK